MQHADLERILITGLCRNVDALGASSEARSKPVDSRQCSQHLVLRGVRGYASADLSRSVAEKNCRCDVCSHCLESNFKRGSAGILAFILLEA